MTYIVETLERYSLKLSVIDCILEEKYCELEAFPTAYEIFMRLIQ